MGRVADPSGLTQGQRIGLLAARTAQGVSNAEVQQHLQVCAGTAASLLVITERRMQMTRARCKGLRPGPAPWRWFLMADQAHQWLASEHAGLATRLCLEDGLSAAEAGRAADAVLARAEFRAPRPMKARVELELKRYGKNPGRASNTVKRPPRGASALDVPGELPWADRPAVITSATKVTVYERTPEPHRINLLADPLPGVPGWRAGPCLREGAQDFRRHQAAATQAAGARP